MSLMQGSLIILECICALFQHPPVECWVSQFYTTSRNALGTLPTPYINPTYNPSFLITTCACPSLQGPELVDVHPADGDCHAVCGALLPRLCCLPWTTVSALHPRTAPRGLTNVGWGLG